MLLALACTAIGQDPAADATAKYLAGLPVRGTPLESHGVGHDWAVHASQFDAAWRKLEARQLEKIRAWAPTYLRDAYTERGPMFYLFSGPDFLYAQAFFPHARTYLLCGIEPVGAIPDVTKVAPNALPSALANLRKSLDSLLSWSFFITKNMQVDLTQTQLSGTLPVLYVFLARSGCRIESVELVGLDNEGQLATGKGTAPGVQIKFFGPGGHAQTLYYFSSDLENNGIRSQPGFLKFCEQQGKGVSLLKAASYLLHGNGFSTARDFLLTHSKLILQDDSGIPLRFFIPKRWTVRYFGYFTAPTELFQQYPQPDLANAYYESHPAPLEFGFGYQWQPNRSSLLIATPK